MRYASTAIPRPTAIRRLGAGVIALGMAADAGVHAIANHAHELAVVGFTPGEHLAHLGVFAGMALVLAAVAAEGLDAHARRPVRQERSGSHAVR